MAFWIVSDVCGDLPGSYIQEQKDLQMVTMSYQVDGAVMEINPLDPNPDQTARGFYQHLNNGASATTFQV
ncbi:MAG: hypothetical protein FWF86_05450, partial [Clostridia bacterium]|nr:hypothetical protein [Clostridia bacterium]